MSTVIERLILQNYRRYHGWDFKTKSYENLFASYPFERRLKVVKNTNISVGFIIEHWESLTESLSKSMYTEKENEFNEAFYSRPDITWDVVEEHERDFVWYFQLLCKYNGQNFNHQSFIDRIEWFQAYRCPLIKRNGTIFRNRKATVENITDWINFIQSQNPHLDLSIVEAHPDWDWEWPSLSSHPKLTVEFVEKFEDRNWSVITLLDLGCE